MGGRGTFLYRKICVWLIADWSGKLKRAATLLNISVQFITTSVTCLDKWEQFPERKRKLAWLHIRAWPAANANDSYDTGSSWSLRRDETQTKLRGKRKQGGGQLHPVTSVDRFPSLFWLLQTEPDLTVALGSNFLEMWMEYKIHRQLHIFLLQGYTHTHTCITYIRQGNSRFLAPDLEWQWTVLMGNYSAIWKPLSLCVCW
jgi:hypothetical protein